jgi:hypothetical protein
MSNAGKYIKRDQWKKWQQNRQRVQDARERDEREAEAIRLLNQQTNSGQRREG